MVGTRATIVEPLGGDLVILADEAGGGGGGAEGTISGGSMG